MKTKLLSLLLGTMFGLVACTVDDNSATSTEEPDRPYVTELDYSSVKCDAPVFVSYNLVPEVRAAVETYLTNITSIEEATVAVVKSEDVPVYEEQLVDLYNRGGLIVLARPTFENVDKFADKYAICQQLPTDASQSVMLFAFDNKQNSFVLFGDGPQDHSAAEAEEVEVIVPDEPITEDPEPEKVVEDQQTYNKRRIFEFFRWVKSERAKQAATRGTTWVSTYDPYLFFKQCQHITHNYDFSLKHKMVQVAGCNADYLEANGSVEVGYDVYAAYVFEGSANAGDYYIVTRRLTVHNRDFYSDSRTKMHGGIKMWLGGFFMRGFTLKSKLKYGNDDLKNALFASEVTPSTTVNATSYSTGFSLGLDGALSLGTESGVSCGFGASYSSSNSTTISDLEIKKETDSQNRSVTHIYTVKNIPTVLTQKALKLWHGISKLTSQLPPISYSDFDAISEWAWEVPAGTNNVGDNKDTKFQIYTDFEYNYGSLVNSSILFYIRDGSWSHGGACSQNITPPMRTPFGVLALKNAHPQSIARVKIWEQNANAGKGTPFTTIASSYGEGEIAKCALPEGTYHIEYDQVEGSKNETIGSWKIDNVKIQRGSSEGNATTEVSTTDAVER